MSASVQMEATAQPMFQYSAAPTQVQYVGQPTTVQYAQPVQYMQQPAVQYAAPTVSYAPAMQYAQYAAAPAEPSGAVTYAAPQQYTYVQQEGQQVAYAAPQAVAQQPYVTHGAEAGVTYAAQPAVYAEQQQPVTYVVQGEGGQQYVTSEAPQAYQHAPQVYQHPSRLSSFFTLRQQGYLPPDDYVMQPALGAEENPVAGAQTFVMPQGLQVAPQPPGMQTVQSMVMPMPNYLLNQPATENAPGITQTPAPAGADAAPTGASAKASTKVSKKGSKKSGKSSKKKKSGCC